MRSHWLFFLAIALPSAIAVYFTSDWTKVSTEHGVKCGESLSYDVEIETKAKGGFTIPQPQQKVHIRLSLTPVAQDRDRVLLNAQQWRPDGTVGANLFVLREQSGKQRLYTQGSNPDKAQNNLLKYALSALSFERQAVRGKPVLEVDTIGEFEAEYRSSGLSILRRKTRYTRLHERGILPIVKASTATFILRRSNLEIASVDIEEDFSQKTIGSEPIESTVKILAKEVPSHFTSTPLCVARTVDELIADLVPISLAYKFELPAAPNKVLSTSERKQAFAAMENLSDHDVLTKLSDAAGSDGSLAAKIRAEAQRNLRREDIAARYIAVLGALRTSEGQAALRELMGFYRQKKAWSLLIHTMRAQQLADWISRENTLELHDYSRDKHLPQNVHQAALLSTGSAGRTLGDTILSQKLAEGWTAEYSQPKQTHQERLALVAALGNLAEPASTVFLKQIAEGVDVFLATEGIDSLRRIPTPEAKQVLLNYAQQKSSPEKMRAALFALSSRQLDEADVKVLIREYHANAQQFGVSGVPDRLQLLSLITQHAQTSLPAVQKFIRDEIPRSPATTKGEREFLAQLE